MLRGIWGNGKTGRGGGQEKTYHASKRQVDSGSKRMPGPLEKSKRGEKTSTYLTKKKKNRWSGDFQKKCGHGTKMGPKRVE